MELSDTSVYVVGGALVLPKLIDLGMSFFKGSVSRNVEQEDRAKERLEAEVEDLKRDATDRKLEVQSLKQDHEHHKQSITVALATITSQLTHLDTRISESSKELAVELNRKLSATLGNEIPEIVRQTLREMKGRGRGR